MSRNTQPANATATDKKPFHEVVAEELIRQLEAGTAPWQKPWTANAGVGFLPMNPLTGGVYKGINAIHLMAQGRGDSRWMTYKQANAMDAQVRKGERGTQIQYWRFEDLKPALDAAGHPVKDDKGQPVHIRVKLESPRVFYATVFNAEQVDGLPALAPPVLTWDPIVRAEQILSNSSAVIHHEYMDRAYYSSSKDEIHLPLKAQFDVAAKYYATALHELAHWSGHDTRLKRDLKHPFGSEGYAREELRAEIASLMISSDLGLPHDPGQHASYVGSWIKVLQKDPLEIFRAAADAQKIHRFIEDFSQKVDQNVDSNSIEAAKRSMSRRSMPVPVIERMTQAAVLAEVDKYVGQFAHEPTIVVRTTAKDVLPGARDGDAISGAVHDSKIFLFFDQLSSARDVQETLFHELLHYGVRRIFSRDQFIEEMHKLYRRDAELKKYADYWIATPDGVMAENFGGADYARARGVDEALALLAEPNAGAFIQTDALNRMVQTVTRWLAELAEKFGFTHVAANLRGYKNHEAREFIQNVFERLKTDPKPTFSGAWESTDTAYSKRPNLEVLSTSIESSLSPDITKESPMSSEDQIQKPLTTVSNRQDLNNELNLEVVAKKRALDRDKAQREMGFSDESFDATPTGNPSQEMNGVERADLGIDATSDPEGDTRLGADQVLQRLAREYQFDGVSKYYFRETQGQQLAFEDRGSEVLTPHHSAEVVGSVAMLIHSRGWKNINVKGTDAFKREMWLQASLLGMKVTGYVPQPIDFIQLDERRATLSADRTKAQSQQLNSVQNGQAQDLEPTVNAQVPSASASGVLDEQIRAALTAQGAGDERVLSKVLGSLNEKIVSDRSYVGELLDFGAAHYKFDKEEKESYFVKLKTALGEETIWGVQLARAMEDLHAKGPVKGPILLAFQGAKVVKTNVRIRDAEGKTIGWEPAVVNRNEWFAQSVLDSYAQAKRDLESDPELKKQTPIRQDQVLGGESNASAPESAQTLADGTHAAASDQKSPQPTLITPKRSEAGQEGLESARALLRNIKTSSVNASTEMRAAVAPPDLIRRALDGLGVSNLERETTVVALSDLYDSAKFHVGTMLEHGKAPYAFQPNGQSSYYARIATENGDVLIWGADLARAVKNQVLEGQTVVIAYRGLESVPDANGPTTRRNDWLVAPLKTLHEDAQQGVIHAGSGLKTQAEVPDFSFMNKRDRQAMEVLAQAMRLAKVPEEIAADTLKQAQLLVQNSPKPVKTASNAPQTKVRAATPKVQRKAMGPSL